MTETEHPTCDHATLWMRDGEHIPCGRPANWRYPAMGGGFAYLCEDHAQRHLEYAEAISMRRPDDPAR